MNMEPKDPPSGLFMNGQFASIDNTGSANLKWNDLKEKEEELLRMISTVTLDAKEIPSVKKRIALLETKIKAHEEMMLSEEIRLKTHQLKVFWSRCLARTCKEERNLLSNSVKEALSALELARSSANALDKEIDQTKQMLVTAGDAEEFKNFLRLTISMKEKRAVCLQKKVAITTFQLRDAKKMLLEAEANLKTKEAAHKELLEREIVLRSEFVTLRNDYASIYIDLKLAQSRLKSEEECFQKYVELLGQLLQIRMGRLDLDSLEDGREVGPSSLEFTKDKLVVEERTDEISKSKFVNFLNEIRTFPFADNFGEELYIESHSSYLTAAGFMEDQESVKESLEHLRCSVAICPAEIGRTPFSLMNPLLPHQESVFQWLVWRECQVPAGGILSYENIFDKFPIIALILYQNEQNPPPTTSTDIWLSKTTTIKRSFGTLVVTHRDSIGPWKNKITRICKSISLSTVIFHDLDDKELASKLCDFSVVVTTYNTVRNDQDESTNRTDAITEKRKSVLLQIAFERVILDEAYGIRNLDEATAQAVNKLRAVRRWAIVGVPALAKETTVFSLVRYLRLWPFNQLKVWNIWMDSKSGEDTTAASNLKLLIETLVLRQPLAGDK